MARKTPINVGDQCNMLTVLGLHKHSGPKKLWTCSCECGNTIVLRTWALRNGNQMSCGCTSLRGRPPRYTQDEAKTRATAAHIASKQRLHTMICKAKLERGCAACGYNSHPYALQFDHIQPIKNKTRSRPRWRNADVLRVESLISLQRALVDTNIQVLCSNCHSIKTVTERCKNSSYE